jgi:hypothetical protein
VAGVEEMKDMTGMDIMTGMNIMTVMKGMKNGVKKEGRIAQ